MREQKPDLEKLHFSPDWLKLSWWHWTCIFEAVGLAPFIIAAADSKHETVAWSEEHRPSGTGAVVGSGAVAA